MLRTNGIPKVVSYSLSVLRAPAALIGAGGPLHAQDKKPNILSIMGDDIGWMQPSCYRRGLMVGETPNIDRVARSARIRCPDRELHATKSDI
jgi:arylsulfatase